MKFFLIFLFSLNLFSSDIALKCTYKASEIPDSVKEYSNYNYSLTIDNNGEIKVEIKYKPFKLKAKYPYKFNNKKLIRLIKQNSKNSKDLLLLAENIVKKSKGYYQCVDNVLKFISLNFKYSKKIAPPFKGDCNIAAETTVKMLALCKIPARIRYVIKLDEKTAVIISGKSLHAVVEIYYPDYGWVFSDPVKYHHFIPASYLFVDKSEHLLGIKFSKKNCLTGKGFTDILEGKIIINKLPNLLRFY